MKNFVAIILSSLAVLASATDAPHTPPAPYKKPPTPCPTTLTVPPIRDCSGCTTTIYHNTDTASVDCKGCKTLVTSTSYEPWVGLCPVCAKGVQTVYNTTGTSTVTSCSVTPPPGPSKK